MAEPENVSNISDWRLTAKEFKKKYQDGKTDNPANTTDDGLPDAVASNASEEATMTSAKLRRCKQLRHLSCSDSEF